MANDKDTFMTAVNTTRGVAKQEVDGKNTTIGGATIDSLINAGYKITISGIVYEGATTKKATAIGI